MGRSSTQELLKKVMEELSNGPQSIAELAERTNFDRTAITRYLELFVNIGVASENSDGRKRMFKLINSYVPNKNTYFNLPLTAEQEKLINSLYAKIRNLWLQKTKKYPAKIQVQKSLFRINKKCDLNLPIGWYLFGALCVKLYDPEVEYEFTDLDETVEECANTVVQEYAKDEFAHELMTRQYEEEGNSFYLLKGEILRILYRNDFSRKDLGDLHSKLRQLFLQAPKPRDEGYHKILNKHLDLIVSLMSFLDDKILKLIHQKIIGSFEDVWKLIALYNYKNDLKEFYPLDVLDRCFAESIAQQKKEIIGRFSDLQSVLLSQQEPEHESYKETKESEI